MNFGLVSQVLFLIDERAKGWYIQMFITELSIKNWIIKN